MERFIGLIGIVVIFLIVFMMSNNRKAINYKTIGTGFLLQILLAVFIFKVPIGQKMFLMIGLFIQKILEFATEGGLFVFGALLQNDRLIELFGKSGTIFAVQLICTNIFMMVLVNILYYYGVMQRIVAILGKVMNKNFFNEFVVEVEDSDKYLAKLKEANILGGIKLDDRRVLVCATEMNTEEEILDYIEAL